MKGLTKYVIFILLNVIALLVCFSIGISTPMFIIILILISNLCFFIFRMLKFKKHSNLQSAGKGHPTQKSGYDQERIMRHASTVEYSNNLLKLMYRQEDIQKAINFIGNEFNILKYNYFFIADVELVSIISDEIIEVEDSQNLVAIVYQNGADKFLEINNLSHKIESALGQKQVTNLYYFVLQKEERKYGIAELGFNKAIDAEAIENLKMCLNELTKF